MKRLFLDDIRIPSTCISYMKPNDVYREDNWDIVRNYKEFVNYIEENGVPDEISFDHDLAEIHYDPSTWTEKFVYQEETGYDCVRWLAQYCVDNLIPMPTCYVHSMNPVGRENIWSVINSTNKILNKVI